MTHLTITGPYAGTPLCDVNKVEAKLRGEKFVHAMYAPIDKIDDLCEACKAEWDAAADEPNDCAECARSFGPHYTGECEHE